jgi:hypothetical protein
MLLAERPLVIFRASPFVVFQQITVININIRQPGALRDACSAARCRMAGTMRRCADALRALACARTQ